VTPLRRPYHAYIAKPKFHHKGLKKNDLGFPHRRLRRARSRPFAPALRPRFDHGLDHRSCFELSIEPHRVARFRLGCLVEDALIFLGSSHGFTPVHVPASVVPDLAPPRQSATNLSRRLRRRRCPPRSASSSSRHSIGAASMTYIVETTAVYGLTKGQFSAAADLGFEVQEGRSEHRKRHRSRGDRAAIGVRAMWRGAFPRQDPARAADRGRDSNAQGGASSTSSIPLRGLPTTPARPELRYVREHNDASTGSTSSQGATILSITRRCTVLWSSSIRTRLALRKARRGFNDAMTAWAPAVPAEHAASCQIVTGLLYFRSGFRRPAHPLNTVRRRSTALDANDPVASGSTVPGQDHRQPAFKHDPESAIAVFPELYKRGAFARYQCSTKSLGVIPGQRSHSLATQFGRALSASGSGGAEETAGLASQGIEVFKPRHAPSTSKATLMPNAFRCISSMRAPIASRVERRLGC